MGQKVHPYGIRLGYIKDWKAKWFAKREYKENLYEDLMLRKKAKAMLKHSGVSHIDIERSAGRVRLKIHSARPGIVIGRKGAEIDKLRNALGKLSDKDIFIDIKEVKNPMINAQLVAENVAQQLERRVSYRRAMKKAISACLAKGGDGIKIQCAGRLGGAEIARTEGYKEGKIPLSTFRANVDYGFAEARTTYGIIGVKVWLYVENQAILESAESEEDSKKQRRDRKRRAPKDAAPKDVATKEDTPKEEVAVAEKPSTEPKANEGDVDNAVDAVEG